MGSRWPFCFDPDDVDVRSYGGLRFGKGPVTQAVVLVHGPTGTRVVMGEYASRDANVRAGFRRLDRELRRGNP